MWDVFDVRTCRGCGCTDAEGCWPPCFWVDQAWCSACEVRLGRRLTLVAAVSAALAAVGSVTAAGLATSERWDGAIAVGVVSLLAIGVALVLGAVARPMLEVEP